MAKRYLLLVSALCCWFLAIGQMTINGQLLLGNSEQGAPGLPVGLWENDNLLAETNSDDDGSFVFEFELNTVSGLNFLEVRTFDLCTGDVVSIPVLVTPAQTAYSVVIVICPGIDPPPPPEGCEAFFYAEQTPSDEPFTVVFADLSYSEFPIIDWLWDFGDGESSAETSPLHVYDGPGEYLVTLTISSGSCSSIYEQVINVVDLNDCNCPADVYDPVCVATASGLELTFINACYAECAGYGPDQYYSCDGGGCGCPEIYAPVCVIGPDGDLVQFDNACEAECAGFGPDQFVECEDECGCDQVWDPVCVNLFGLSLQFPNLCTALCEGFTDDQIVDCDDDCPCPDVWDPVCVQTADGTTLTFGNACEAECAGYGPNQIIPCDDDCICPDVWDPVCVFTTVGVLTFGNACEAECAGYGPDQYVPCDGECPCPEYLDPVCVIGPDGQIIQFDNPCFAACEGYGEDQFVDCNGTTCDCPEDVYDPVCVLVPGCGPLTFENSCYAECEGYGPELYVNCNEDCPCPDVWDPVCVQTPFGLYTFGNSCEAECYGYTEEDFVSCTDECICPDIYDPVCVMTGGGIFTFDNACYAECEGFNPDDFVECDDDCICPQVYDPVCVLTASGEIVQFTNACYAACEGFGEDSFVDCDDDCGCNDIFAPVCVMIGNAIAQFDNACEAECAGYGPDSFVDCDENCWCPPIFDPVCIATPSGGFLQFNNACEAECEGFSPDDFVDCPDDCLCDDVYDPVCVATDIGFVILFNNACEAECAGYTDYFDCNQGNCTVNFSVTQTDDYTYSFSALSTTADPIASYTWDFGDGETSTEVNPVHIYPNEPGIYVVTLTVINSFGCVATATEIIYIGPDCYANIIALPLEENPLSIAFGAVASGEVVEWSWSFGDGATSNEGAPVHTYQTEGVYEVSLTIVTEDGCTFTDILDLEVGGDDCICPDVWDPVCVNGFAGIITFSNACEAECAGFTPEYFVDCEGCDCPEIWDPVCIAGFDGQVIYANACEAICAGFSPDQLVDCEEENECDCLDVYDPVCVTTPFGIITYANSCEAQCDGYCPDDFYDCGPCVCPDIYDPVCVIDPFFGIIIEFPNACEAECAGFGPDQYIPCDNTEDCFADFGFDLVSEDGLLVQFQDYSVTDSPILSWEWDFGDGGTSTEQNPQHEYADAGVYDVSLTITTDACTATIIHHICVGEGGGVTGPNCQAMFFFEQPDPDDLQYFQFWDVSFGGVAVEWFWDFGDGGSSTEANPTHLFEQAGTYTVSLTITTEDGCTSTVAIVITTDYNIWYGDQMCRAWFLPIIDQASNAVFFINLSSPDAVEFLWDFGDGTTSTDPLAFHEYEAAGVYTVSLTIVTESGCENTFIVTITLGDEDGFSGNPEFSFTVGTDEEQLLDQTIRVAPNPTNGQTIVSWESDNTGAYQWQLFDLSGRLVQQGQGAQGNQRERVDLDLNNEPGGVYLFRLQTTDGMKTLKVTKI